MTMIRLSANLGVLCSLALLGAAHAADSHSPVGQWKTIDDQSGKPKSIIQITENNGVLTGTIVELLEGAAEKTCSKCEGDQKDRPLVGMKILWDLKKEGDQWTDGKIFNPADGGVYSSKAKLIDEGKTLEVTGKWMFFSKQQQWRRVK